MKKISVLIGICLLFTANVSAQCAMCRATIESSISDGGGIANGLNTGIIYLMLMPYVLLASIGYFWYKHSKQATEKRMRILQMLNKASLQ